MAMAGAERLKVFNNLVLELRKCQPTGGIRNDGDGDTIVTEIDDLLAVLSKESDVSAFEAHVDGVLNLHWLITHCIVKRVAPPQQPSWNSSLWKGIELLSKLVDQSDSIRKLARDEVRMFVTLTDMLQLDLSPGQICTVLAFLRHLVYGIRIRRVDVTLTTLLTKLLSFLVSPELEQLRPYVLFILICLTRNHSRVTRTLLSLMSEKHRKDIFANSRLDPVSVALTIQLTFYLSRTSLSFFDLWTSCRLQKYLQGISDAFCVCLSKEDYYVTWILSDFLTDMRDVIMQQKLSVDNQMLKSVIEQVVLAADFSDGARLRGKECVCKFIHEIAKLSSDMFPLIDTIIKAIHFRLESHGAEEAFETVQLTKSIVWYLKPRMSDLEETQCQNIRLQLEPILAILCRIAFSSYDREKQLETWDANSKTLNFILDTLSLICQISSFKDFVDHRITPSDLTGKIKSLLREPSGLASNTPSLIPSYLLLLKILSECEESTDEWQTAYSTVWADSNLRRFLWKRVCDQNSSASRSEKRKIIVLLGDVHALPFQSSEDTDGEDDCVSTSELQLQEATDFKAYEEQTITALLEKVSKSMDLQNTDPDFSEILELGDIRFTLQKAQIEQLLSSLHAADVHIATLNHENVRLRSLTSRLLERSREAENQLQDIEVQHAAMQKETNDFRASIRKECSDKDKIISSLKEDNERSSSTLANYKHQIDNLQEAIVEHQNKQKEIEAQMKAETEANADLVLALAGREDELHKKTTELEEEILRNEKLQVDYDNVRKELSNLHTLSNRQQQVIAKKEKQLQEKQDELHEYKRVQEQIFNLSKFSKAKK